MDAELNNPTSYAGWLARLANVSNKDLMLNAAANAAAYNPDKKQARHDVAMIIYEKYIVEKKRGEDNQFVTKNVKEKYETLSQALFGSLSSLVAYGENHTPKPTIYRNNGKDPV